MSPAVSPEEIPTLGVQLWGLVVENSQVVGSGVWGAWCPPGWTLKSAGSQAWWCQVVREASRVNACGWMNGQTDVVCPHSGVLFVKRSELRTRARGWTLKTRSSRSDTEGQAECDSAYRKRPGQANPQTESGFVGPGAGGRGRLLTGTGSPLVGEKVLEADRGGGCTTL